MQAPQKPVLLRNVANVVSIPGVLPLCILFWEHGYEYLIPLIVYNNIIDDLDGVLAGKLDIRSNFGAMLDNVCDAISHHIFVLVVGMHYSQQEDNPFVGSACAAGSLLATVAIGLVNVALVVAWLVPFLAPVIAASFIGTYFLSFLTGGTAWLKSVDSETSP